uniref:Lon peptidase 2, peroxisomal n=1 Tax=Eptatretus burgeri TaxID=7764 RepID=A0A8C4R434_EPTBU
MGVDVLRSVRPSVLVELLDTSVPVVAKFRRLLDTLPSEVLPDIIASMIRTSPSEKLEILDTIDLEERFKRTIPLLIRQIESLRLLKKARGAHLEDYEGLIKNLFPKVDSSVIDTSENGWGDDDDDSFGGLERKMRGVGMSEPALRTCLKELKRLKKMPQSMPEYALIQSYLDLMVELPWKKSTKDRLDIHAARTVLDDDHHALHKLKRRVLEYLAVRKLKTDLRGPILCFVGPPGVGKTSVGRSIAKTLGREFHRISLGGVCDQSDIRGHRRTYVGSMPGRIIGGLRAVTVNNPVFLLDEVDKLGRGIHGDPSAALLEVLDPEQNSTFTDHYLNVPFDLSQVLFLATANRTTTIPPALLDRMEVIEVPGYTQEEKGEIAARHLVPKQVRQHGLTEKHMQLPIATLSTLISRYTREAGVRTLERKIGAVCRAVAVRVAENWIEGSKKNKQDVEEQETVPLSELACNDVHPLPEMPIIIDDHALRDILGAPIYEMEVSERLSQPGVALGLAWTSVGGELMFVEASRMEGDGQLKLTGQLGEVMKESAQLAITWLRSNARRYDLCNSKRLLPVCTDVHLHFPAGAVTKDGPSAGVAMVVCLASLFSDRLVRSDVAMTGEITLRGLVLPVGGVKDKVLAAHRAGIRCVILPEKNSKDLDEVPTNVSADLDFAFVCDLDGVLQAAFEGGFPRTPTHRQLVQSKL